MLSVQYKILENKFFSVRGECKCGRIGEAKRRTDFSRIVIRLFRWRVWVWSKGTATAKHAMLLRHLAQTAHSLLERRCVGRRRLCWKQTSLWVCAECFCSVLKFMLCVWRGLGQSVYLYSLRFCLLLSWQLLLTWPYNLSSKAAERCECHGCARCHSFSDGRAMERQQRERRQYVTTSARRGHQRKPCVFNSGFGDRPAAFRAWLVRVHCPNGFFTTSCCEHRALQPVRLTKAGPVSIY
jgi:hypothetical protein